MKKIIKSNFKIFITIIITAIICISGTVYAEKIYYAKDINFKPTNTEWKVDNVEDAINNLYSNIDKEKEYSVLSNITNINPTTNYTIKESDLEYKQIMVYVSSVNYSSGNYNASITVSNDNIKVISNDSVYKYTDGGKNVTNKVYIGVLENIILDDVISISGYYGTTVKIIGIK